MPRTNIIMTQGSIKGEKYNIILRGGKEGKHKQGLLKVNLKTDSPKRRQLSPC